MSDAAEIRRLRARVAELEKILLEVEFSNYNCGNTCRRVDNTMCDHDVPHCPDCGRAVTKKHGQLCDVARALGRP